MAPDTPAVQRNSERSLGQALLSVGGERDPYASFGDLGRIIYRHRRVSIGIVSASLLICLIYCLVAPNQYEAKLRVALRTEPATTLTLPGQSGAISASLASGQTQLETLADVIRSDQLAWRIILEQKLYQAPGFAGRFPIRFPDFHPDSASPQARAYLLERFAGGLRVRTIPRTLLMEIRFRSGDPQLSADVVTALIHDYAEQESEIRLAATTTATGWLESQLHDLKARLEKDDRELAAFQRHQRILITPVSLWNGQERSSEHLSALLEVDDLSHELVTARAERITREAEYQAAMHGDPELVLAADGRSQSESGSLSSAAFRQIHTRRSELDQERAQLSSEHGSNFPRVVEIRQQVLDLDGQLKTEDAKLVERFRMAWQTALSRELLVRMSLDERTEAGFKVNESAARYEAIRMEADSSRALYVRTEDAVAEARLAAGTHGSEIWIVDAAYVPAQPVAPNLLILSALTLFLSSCVAFAVAAAMDKYSLSRRALIPVLLLAGVCGIPSKAQAPTPNTSGLPAGVAHIPATSDTRSVPNAREAPAVWNGSLASALPSGPNSPSLSLPALIGPGDLIDVSEFHTPEFHSTVRVSADGTVTLPMIGAVHIAGLDEQRAAIVIADALRSQDILKHPQVFVLITAFVGQDVSVLGEVARPGVYAYTAHHRLLDFIALASGLGPLAGSVVSVYHREDPVPLLLALESGSATTLPGQNPELAPGDTVQVSRAGLVYVVGDVNRPGGFAVDPAQKTTVLQALSLAWGPSQSALVQKALLLHEVPGGRTVTTLNLKRMLRGQDPDMLVQQRDILFVPDSAVKNLWNRTMESVVQSAAGVSIYAGLVYSQRF